jgi:hypothetical protein
MKRRWGDYLVEWWPVKMLSLVLVALCDMLLPAAWLPGIATAQIQAKALISEGVGLKRVNR